MKVFMSSRNVKARMLHWKISFDQRVNSLSGPWPMLLYTWLIPCQDNLGRLEGDADVVKGMVFPKLSKITYKHVHTWLNELHDVGLVFRYSYNGSLWLQFPIDSVKNYQKIVGNMRDYSELPEPPEKEYSNWLRDIRGSMNKYERVQTCSSEGKGREGKGSIFTPPTLDEVKAYVEEKGYSLIDPNNFFSFYESKGWMVGRNRMTNWRAAVSGWERREHGQRRAKDFEGVSPSVRLAREAARRAPRGK